MKNNNYLCKIDLSKLEQIKAEIGAEFGIKKGTSDSPAKVKSRLFQGLQPYPLELLTRFELVTSSLPIPSKSC